MSMLKEFKAFAMRGNVVDMAVGIIIGGAFDKIIASLVNDVIMPPIGMLLGGVDFADLKIVLKQAVINAEGVETIPPVAINYGLLVNNIINFLIVVFCMFMVIKTMNSMKKKEQAAPAAPPAPSAEEQLLTEIRDTLRSR